MNDWLLNLLLSGAFIGGFIWIVKKFVIEKIKHYFDLRLENLKPLTAEETLKRQNYLNSKRDVFFDAISIVSRHLEAVPWSGPDIPKDRYIRDVRPDEYEVNTCLAKLSLYSDDPKIPDEFLNCFGNATAVSLGHFVNRLRMDLGYGELTSNPEDYKYFIKREPTQK